MLLWLGVTAGVLGIIAVVVWRRFAAALSFHRSRVARGSQVVPSRFGQIEFATVGEGPPVLVAHGGAGGFESGDRRRRPMPFVDGDCSGGLCRPACPRTAARSRSDGQGDYWVHRQVRLSLLAGNDSGARSDDPLAVGHRSPLSWLRRTPAERQRALNMLWNLMPISRRSQGVLNDVRFASAPQSIAVEGIKAPMLVVSLEDDFFRTLAAARFIAAHVPGARLLTYASGGHVWVGHDAELFAEVDAFIRTALATRDGVGTCQGAARIAGRSDEPPVFHRRCDE